MFELRARQRPLAAVLAALGLSAAVSADLPRMTRLADGVYMYEHLDPTKAGVTANNLVVIGADAVLVADGQGTVENTGDLVTAIAAITKTPIIRARIAQTRTASDPLSLRAITVRTLARCPGLSPG